MNYFSRYKAIFIFFVSLIFLYASIRIYFAVTAGFTVGNITSDLTYDHRWSTHSLSSTENQQINHALDQNYAYLGKGCQAYVFESEDKEYVIKFFKYQRFRPQAWINTLTFIPAVERYQQNKAIEKKNKLDSVYRSWKIAYEDLSRETGVVYLHLNKSDDLHKKITILDKMGIQHQLDLDQMEFLVQHKAEMLCSTLKTMIEEKKTFQAEVLIDRMLSMLLSEYMRGYADNDHALMQNTGVWDGYPVHIDVGQFIYNPSVKNPAVFGQELYDKTYKFHLWLKKHDEHLATYLRNRIVAVIGEEYFLKGPYVHKSDVAKIPHVEKER